MDAVEAIKQAQRADARGREVVGSRLSAEDAVNTRQDFPMSVSHVEGLERRVHGKRLQVRWTRGDLRSRKHHNLVNPPP